MDPFLYNNKEAGAYDEYRTKYLESADISVIRFWNDEIINNIEESLQKIRSKVQEITSKCRPPLKVRGG